MARYQDDLLYCSLVLQSGISFDRASSFLEEIRKWAVYMR